MESQVAEKKLFVSVGPGADVVLNWYGQHLEQLYIYAAEYHDAAKRIVERSLPGELRDVGACPVVFLYRHSLELFLKDILMTGRNFSAEPARAETILNKNHDLMALWSDVKVLLNKMDLWGDELGADEAVILELAKLDQKSNSFRYPVLKSGKPSIVGNQGEVDGKPVPNFAFKLEHFCKTMDEVLERLHGLTGAIKENVQVYREEAFSAE